MDAAMLLVEIGSGFFGTVGHGQSHAVIGIKYP
jgi:hypothetical protein